MKDALFVLLGVCGGLAVFLLGLLWVSWRESRPSALDVFAPWK
jgi:hypothetical protein